MSDSLDRRLRDFAMASPSVSPVDPAEIRRRGVRLRRRRTALTAAAAALAVALVVAPVAALTGRGGGDVEPAPSNPTASESPTEQRTVARLPDDFPLAAGYPEVQDDGTPVEVVPTPGTISIEPCDRLAWAPPRDALDVASVSYVGPEDGRSRSLVLYPDADAAAAALRSFSSVVAQCPSQGEGDDGSAWSEVGSSLGEDSATVTRRYLTQGRPNPGLEVYQLARVANALLVDVSSGEGGGSDGSVESFTDVAAGRVAPVVEAMTMLADRGRVPPDPDAAPTRLPLTLLPTARDLPTRSRLTPWVKAESSDEQLIGCQPDAPLGADELVQRSFSARIAATEGLPAGDDVAAEVRISVLQYESGPAAEAAEAVVNDWIRTCEDPAGTDLDRASRRGEPTETEAGTYATWVYSAPEACTDDCDAVWFERMSVLADQGRMVTVSYRELGGPLEPEGLDVFMRGLMLKAAGRSMPG